MYISSGRRGGRLCLAIGSVGYFVWRRTGVEEYQHRSRMPGCVEILGGRTRSRDAERKVDQGPRCSHCVGSVLGRSHHGRSRQLRAGWSLVVCACEATASQRLCPRAGTTCGCRPWLNSEPIDAEGQKRETRSGGEAWSAEDRNAIFETDCRADARCCGLT